MTTTLQQVLAAKQLTRVISTVVGGVPKDLLPPSFTRDTRNIEGNTASYRKIQSTRQVAKRVNYGDKPRRVNKQGIQDTPVILPHFFETIEHNPVVLQNLLAEGNETRQRLGAETVARQTLEHGRRFQNGRMGQLYSLLTRGKISYSADGDLALTDQAATGGVDIDFSVPAGNQNQLDILGNGAIISASWATASTKIITQLRQIRKEYRQLVGMPLVHALYGENVPSHILDNNQTKELVNRSDVLRDKLAFSSTGEIPMGFLGFQWWPMDQAFFEQTDGSTTEFWGPDTVVFAPEPSTEWLEWIEGSYPIPRNVGMIFADAMDALAQFDIVNGAFSFAKVETSPPSIEQFVGDTVLATLMNGAAILIADVTP
ncbi:hypothetical protein LCGC14_0392460 [marine sediment metagenome]|uniref:Major capsid protein n=1 Tax=marine sediment metagenome TaxID=412755 RepID=A0A0F9THE1_9ZZZZ